jgi:flagellar basal-body rod protein FlgC
MIMFSTFDVSTSGLVAQRQRLNAISSNLANISTTRNERGEPEAYQPRYVTFQTDAELATNGGGLGVKVGSVEYSEAPPLMKYEPGHPDANASGYVVSTLSKPLGRTRQTSACWRLPRRWATERCKSLRKVGLSLREMRFYELDLQHNGDAERPPLAAVAEQ